MAERRISILIDTTGNPAGIDLIENRFAGLEASADQLFGALKAGMAIDIGGRLVSGLASVPGMLRQAVERGVAFNQTIGDAEMGIANVLAKFQGLDRAASKQEAARAMAKIAELEPKVAGTMSDLVQGFLATVAASQSAGLSVEQNIDLVGKFANALANSNIHASQLAQEMRSILSGNIGADSSLARVLGITNADINRAKEQGQLYAFLTKEIGSLGEAGDSAAVAFSSLESAIDQTLGKITKPVFADIVKGAKEMTATLQDPEIVDSLRGLGGEIAKLVEAGYDLTQWAVKNTDLLVFLARAAATYGAALTTIKIVDLLEGLARKAVALVASRAALDAETAALARNTAAQAANTGARVAGATGGVPSAGGFRDVAKTYGAMSMGQIGGQYASAWGHRGTFGGAITAGSMARTTVGVGAGLLAAVPAAGTAALVTYVVGEMIAQGVISRAEGRAAAVEAAGESSVQQIRGFANEGADVATLKEQIALLKRITEARRSIAQAEAAAAASGDSTLTAVYRRQLAALDLLYDRTRGIGAEELGRREAARATVQYLNAQADAMERLKPLVETAAQELADAQFAALSPEEQLAKLRSKRGEVTGGLGESEAAFAAAEGNAAEAEAARLEVLRAKKQLADLNKAILALEEKIAGASKKTADEATRAADAKRSQGDARANITSEILAAEARARGDTDAAERLERQKRLREEIRAIVEATGVSEAQAEAVARRKILAEDAAAKRAASDADGLGAGRRMPDWETSEQTRERLRRGETREEQMQRMSGGRWAVPPPSVPFVPSFTSVVPAAPASARPGAGEARGGDRAGQPAVSDALLYELAAEVRSTRGEKQAEAEKAFDAYAAAIREALAAGDKRYAELVARIAIAESQIKTARTR